MQEIYFRCRGSAVFYFNAVLCVFLLTLDFCCFVNHDTRNCVCHCPAVLTVFHECVVWFHSGSPWIGGKRNDGNAAKAFRASDVYCFA